MSWSTPLAYLAPALDQTDQARHRHHAAGRTHAGQCRDAQRRSMPWQVRGSSPARCVRAADRRRLDGQTLGRPYHRYKDYVAIMRKIFPAGGAGGA